jgi:hypothetical protein
MLFKSACTALAVSLILSGVGMCGVPEIPACQKIRAGYMSINNSDLIPRMAREGFNTALVKFGQFEYPPTQAQLESVKTWARLCGQHGIHFMPVINFWGSHEISWMKPGSNLVYNQTEYKKTPCPFSENTYRQLIHNRILSLANLSREVPVAGVLIDFEMYGADTLHFPDHCVCDHCFGQFQSSRSSQENIDISKRYAYLQKNNLLKSYRRFFENRVIGFAAETAAAVARIAPDLYIGGLDMDWDLSLELNWNQPDSFFYNALIRGLGTDAKKTLVFTERTYQTGYSDYMKKTAQRFAKSEFPAKLIVGIWQDKIPPEHLAEQYYYVSKETGGYWIYSLELLSEQSQSSPPLFEKDSYWQAAKHANKEIDSLCSDPNHKTSLVLRSFTAPVVPINLGKIVFEKVRYIYHENRTELHQIPVKLRYLNYLVFYAERGDEILFETMFSPRRGSGAPFIETVLLNEDGVVIARGQAHRTSRAELKASATYSGNYFIAIESYGNTAEIVKCSHPYSIQASQTVHLLEPDWEIKFFKPSGSRQIVLMIDTDGIGESVNALIINEQGHLITRRTIARNETIRLTGLDSEPTIFKLLIEPTEKAYFEDVRVRIVSGAVPYLSPWKSGLVQ